MVRGEVREVEGGGKKAEEKSISKFRLRSSIS